MQWQWLPDNDTTIRDIWHVRRVGSSETATSTLDQSRVLYVFRGSAGVSERIRLPGLAPNLFRDEHLYARTAEGLWAIRWKAWLKPSLFRQTHESTFVNLRKQPTLVVDALEWKWYQFTFADGHIERVPISRSFYSDLREEYRSTSTQPLILLHQPQATSKLGQPEKTAECHTKSSALPSHVDEKDQHSLQPTQTASSARSEPS